MKCVTAALSTILTLTSSVEAALVASYAIGSGSSTSFVQFEFANSNAYLYEVRYDGALFGDDLLAIIAAAQPGYFGYEIQSFAFGDVLLGVTIGTDTNTGFGTPPDYLDYWHYWTRESDGEGWTESWTGFGDRAVSNGSWDGWVFNSANGPMQVPAPGTVALLAVTAAWTGTRRRRGSPHR